MRASITIATWALLMTGSAWAEGCNSYRLTPAQWANAVSAAQKTVRLSIDPKSLDACREGKRRYVDFETVHEAQPDGSEVWQWLTCEMVARKSWVCIPHEQRAVRFEPKPGEPKISVNISRSEDMDGVSAVQIASAGYSQAMALEIGQTCRPMHSEYIRRDSFERFRRSFWNKAAGELLLLPEKRLQGESNRLVLYRSDFYVAVERISEADGTWRAVCWGELESLE